MTMLENRAETTSSTTREIEMVAELVIAHLTHSRMLRDHHWFSDPHPDYERDDITPEMYIDAAVEATQSRCALTSVWTGLFLGATYPGRFTRMFLFRSRVPNDTPQGIAESADWSFDTWLMLEDTDGRHYTLSPPLHEHPKSDRMVAVFEGDTQEGAIAHVRAQRPGWDWPDGEQTETFTSSHRTEPSSFYTYDETQRKPHLFTCLTLARNGDTVAVDSSPLQFEKLDIYA